MRDGLLLVHGAVADVLQGRLPLLSTGALDTPAAHAAAVFLLHEDGSGDVRGALQRVRGHRLPSIYLKPVVLLADERGAAATTHGLGGMFISVLQEKVKMFDYAVLKDLVAAEAHRMARYEVSKSTLLILSFHGIEQIYLELGKRAREIFEELAVVFRGILRESDLLSARNESLFLALLMETSAAQAERATERLRGSIDQLLRASLHKPPHFETAIHSLEEGMDVDAVVADLLADRNGAEGVDVP